MSMEFFTACRNYGATALWVAKTPDGDSKADPVNIITGLKGGAEGGPQALHPWSVSNSIYRDFAGASAGNFDESNDYCDTMNSTIITEMDQGFSFVIWYDAFGSTVQASHTLFGVQGGSGGVGHPQLWFRFQEANSTFRLQIKNDAATLWKADTAALANVNSGPHLIACTFDWSEADASGPVPATFYYDGQDAGYVAGTEGDIAGGTTNDGDQNVYIGARNNDGADQNHSPCGYGSFAWFGGTLLTTFQHHELYRLSRMPERPCSPHARRSAVG